MDLKNKALLELFDALQSLNNNELILAGSLGLIEQGINLRREPSDLDIWYPSKHKLVANIPGLEFEELSESGYPEDEDTETSKYTKFKIHGIKVDFFTTISGRHEISHNVNRRRVMPWQVSIKHKTEYAICGFPTSKKHAEDLQYFYSNNDHLFIDTTKML